MNKYLNQLFLAFVTVLFGLLLIVAFLASPMGEIDPSVLGAIGEILTFAGALCGIDYHYHNKSDPHNPHRMFTNSQANEKSQSPMAENSSNSSADAGENFFEHRQPPEKLLQSPSVQPS